MKTILSFSYIVWIIGLVFGCSGNSGEAPPQGTCRIQQYSTVEKAQSYTTTTQATYTYDTDGNLTKSVSTIDGRPMTGTFGSKTGNMTIIYTYNSDGFLLSSDSKQQTTDIGLNNTSKTELYTINSSYSYANGRLSQKIEKYSGTYVPPNEVIVRTYEYDANVNLTRMIVTRPNIADYQEIWSYQNNQLTDVIQKNGSSEQHPFTIQDGVITKMVFPGADRELIVMNTFDDQKRATRIENYINGQLDRYDVQTWADAKPATASLPAFKGLPPYDENFPFSGQAGVLARVEHWSWNTTTKTAQLYGESVSGIQTNAQGYVSNVVTTTSYPPTNGSQPTTYTATYTYTNCQ